MKTLSFKTESAQQTMAFAGKIARKLKQGDVVALSGELGAGKTVFVKGMAYGLEVEKNILVTSPTFVILHEYPGKLPLYHFDFYRFQGREQAEGIGYEEYFEGDGVCAVEWADRFPEIFPPHTLWVNIEPLDETGRAFRIIPAEALAEHWREIEEAIKETG